MRKGADTLLAAANMYKKSAGAMLFPQVAYSLYLRTGIAYFDANEIHKALEILKKTEKSINKLSSDDKVSAGVSNSVLKASMAA